jgi:hypothetical protein
MRKSIGKSMKRTSIIFLITVLVIICGFEITTSHAENLFWINLGL